MSLPDQSAIVSIALIVALTTGATSSGVALGGTEVATRFPPSLQFAGGERRVQGGASPLVGGTIQGPLER